MDSRVSTSTKTERFSETHKTTVSDAHCSLVKKIQEQKPRTPPRKFRVRFNPNGTCTIRPVRDSDNQAKNLGADNNLDLHEKVSSGSCSVLSSDCLQAKQQPEPYSVTSSMKPRQQRQGWSGLYGGFLEVKKQEPERSCEGFLELKLEASKRKFHQQYKSIEDRRKRIKMVDFRDIQVPPEETQNCRRRAVVNIKRN